MPFDVKPIVTPVTTAVLTNEVQPPMVAGGEGLAAAGAAVLPAIIRLVEGARSAGVQVIHCVKVTRVDARGRNRNVPLYRLRGERAPGSGPADGRPDDGSVVAPQIGPDDADLVVTRIHGLGAATDTGLVPILRNLGVTTAVVVGVSLNIGIPNTVMTLVDHGFDVVVPRDAVAGTPEDYGEHMLAHTIRYLATLTTVDALLEAWAPSGRTPPVAIG